MNAPSDYHLFLEDKVPLADETGFVVADCDINPQLKPFVRVIVKWAAAGGRRGIFSSFGLHKTSTQIELARLARINTGAVPLICLPLGVRQEFFDDAERFFQGEYSVELRFIRSTDEMIEDLWPEKPIVYLTNYESIREGKIDTTKFGFVSLDEAACLRGFGGSKTFREFMARLAGDPRGDLVGHEIRYRFVATATPDPNDHIELLAYAAFLGIMDIGQAKTRFFKRNSEKANELAIHPHKEKEFWLWIASWALFVRKPSDLGPEYSDEGYNLPPVKIHWHELPADHAQAGAERDGQGKMFKDTAIGVQNAARVKRDSLQSRTAKLLELLAARPGRHCILWHDLEAERAAIEANIPGVRSIFGAQDLDTNEANAIGFKQGEFPYLGTKPRMSGAGCNFQHHCSWAIFFGIGFKFHDFIQAVHRLVRFGQLNEVDLDLIYTEEEREVRRLLEDRWAKHEAQAERMAAIIREFGLAQVSLAGALTRSFDVERQEVRGERFVCVNNDCVDETRSMEENSVDLIVTSIPFSTQYEYTPSYRDFGHTDNDDHFFLQMDFLTKELLRVLRPGRLAVIHCKDRIIPGGMTGLGFQTVSTFGDETKAHFIRHGFAYIGTKYIITDVVRENNQTYRLGWTEQCKDGTRMGFGLPEYVHVFRKPQTDRAKGYANTPVAKDKEAYSRGRWQLDAHGFGRSSGNRLLTPEELLGKEAKVIFRRWREHSVSAVYDFDRHVDLCEALDANGQLPPTFMLLAPHSWHPDVETDVTRMRTLNGLQHAKGREMHLCLARDSRVLTKERGYVPIQDIRAGEHCLTHLGRWRPILAVANTGVRPVVTLRAQGVPGLTLTPDHKLWVRKSDWIRERDGAEYVQPAWIEAQASLGGYVNLKVPPAEDASIDDPLHWWIVGRWLADGHWEARGSAIISCGAYEVDGLVNQLGGHAGGVYNTGTAHQIRVCDADGSLKDTLRECGAGAAGKHLPPEAFTLPDELAEALLAGYFSGDGHFLGDRQRWMASSVSRDLLLGIAVLAQRVHGAIASVYAGRGPRSAMIEGRTIQCKQDWILSFDGVSDRRKQPFVRDDGAWKKVRSIELAGEVETWCLKVAEDESFTAEGCIVKNCPLQFDIVDRAINQYTMPGETVFDPFGGLMTVPYRAITAGRRGIGVELSPQYFRDGVSYCQEAERDVSAPTLFDLLETTTRVPEPAESDDPGQGAAGGQLECPSMAAPQPGEPEAGEAATVGASAVPPPALLAPDDPASVEGASGFARGHAPPAFYSDAADDEDITPEWRQALQAIAAGEMVEGSVVRDLVGAGLVHALTTRLVITEKGKALLSIRTNHVEQNTVVGKHGLTSGVVLDAPPPAPTGNGGASPSLEIPDLPEFLRRTPSAAA